MSSLRKHESARLGPLSSAIRPVEPELIYGVYPKDSFKHAPDHAVYSDLSPSPLFDTLGADDFRFPDIDILRNPSYEAA